MKKSRVLTTAIALSGALCCGLPVQAWETEALSVLPPRKAEWFVCQGPGGRSNHRDQCK